MEFFDTLKKRVSIRKYKETDISDETILDLIEAARLSQSAKNRQPWLFKILKSDQKNEVAKLMLKWCNTANVGDAENRLGYKNSVENTAKVILQAPVLILVCRQPLDSWRTGDLLSIGAAIEHICLRATDLGLGSLWIRDTVYVQDDILELVRHQELELVSTIAIGYADENPFPRPRKPISDLMLD